MAFYKVIIDGEQFANQHLCRAANRIGDAGILRAVSNKEFSQKQLLGNVLFSIEEEQKENYANIDDQARTQDIDEAFSHLQHVDEESMDKQTVVEISGKALSVYKHNGFCFVKLSDIASEYKYRNQNRMASLHVCGYIYIALDAKIDTEKSPIIVTIKS